MEIVATITKGDEEVRSGELEYAGKVSVFEKSFEGLPAGTYNLRVLVANTKTANFAMYESQVVVR